MTDLTLHNVILVLQVIGMAVTALIGIVEFIIKNQQDATARKLEQLENRVEGIIDHINTL